MFQEIKVTAGVLLQGSRVLIAQRSAEKNGGLKWEFPGGKIEDGESPEDCLIREWKEELDVDVDVIKFICDSNHEHDGITIHLSAFEIKILSGNIQNKEHHDLQWVKISDLMNFNFVPADIKIIEMLQGEIG